MIKTGHYFFHDIRIRTGQLNGDFRIRSNHQLGTVLEISLPVNNSDETLTSKPS